MPTTSPELALRSAREYWLMPLVTTRPGSDVAATTRAARAHAEAVDGAAVGAVMRQRVGGRAQIGMAAHAPKRARSIQRLRMLDPHPDREGLGLDMHAARVEHLEGVARAVADRQHDMVGGEMVAGRELQAADAPRPVRVGRDVEIVDALAEAIFAAERLDRGAHTLDHRHQPEGADMRMRFGQDLGRARRR